MKIQILNTPNIKNYPSDQNEVKKDKASGTTGKATLCSTIKDYLSKISLNDVVLGPLFLAIAIIIPIFPDETGPNPAFTGSVSAIILLSLGIMSGSPALLAAAVGLYSVAVIVTGLYFAGKWIVIHKKEQNDFEKEIASKSEKQLIADLEKLKTLANKKYGMSYININSKIKLINTELAKRRAIDCQESNYTDSSTVLLIDYLNIE